VGYGLASALDTLCSQAFGAGKPLKLGIYLQSAFIVVGACLLPIFLMNWHSGAFLIALGQDPDVSRLAGEFSRYTVFGTPFLFFYEMNRKVLQAQGILKPLVVIMGMGNVVNITLGYYLTYHTSLGFHGAALSRVLAYITLSALLVPYYYMNPSYMRWWPGWKIQQAWSYVGQFLHLGIPGMLMMAMEWWAYEILALMAGILPDAVIAVSAQAVIMTMCSMLYMLFLGVAVAGNIRVGQCLGANMPRKAKMISNLTMRVVFWMSCVIALIVLICRHQIPAIFISDPQSIE
jgi:MATE family multidrug resistance protein